MAAAVVFEGLREIAEDVTEAVVGEEKLGGEFGPLSGEFFGLLDGGSGFEGGGRRKERIGSGGGVRVRVGIGIGSGGRAITGPVTWSAALVTPCCCS